MADERSDENCSLPNTHIRNLAERFDVPAHDLSDAMTLAAEVTRDGKGVRPATKHKLRSLKRKLAELADILEKPDVVGRLIVADQQGPEAGSQLGREAKEQHDGELAYAAYWRARDRVGAANEGIRDMVELLNAAEALPAISGRPAYEEWLPAIVVLKSFWVEDCNRKTTISGHAADPRRPRPSKFLQFVLGCLTELGASVSEQECRSMLLALRARDWKPF